MIEAERHAGRSVSVKCRFYCQKLSHSAGAQSEWSAPHSTPLPIHKLTSYHFYPVAERDDSRANSVDGIGLGAAGNSSTEYGYIQNQQNKKQGAKIPLLKVLESS